MYYTYAGEITLCIISVLFFESDPPRFKMYPSNTLNKGSKSSQEFPILQLLAGPRNASDVTAVATVESLFV